MDSMSIDINSTSDPTARQDRGDDAAVDNELVHAMISAMTTHLESLLPVELIIIHHTKS